MPKFFAITAHGLSDVLMEEMQGLGFSGLHRTSRGVYFESNWQGCYKANLCLRTASRVLYPILDFPAYQNEDLYNNTLKHDFTKYIDPDGTFSVEATVIESSFHDQRFVALKIKDAIADQFREKFGIRPDVDKRSPQLKIVVVVYHNQVSLMIDTSGDPLFKRGYREDQGKAPLKESLAAALLDMTQWDGKIPIVDPMCGSGTFLIEAGMKALKVAPGGMRKRFGFQNLKTFQPEVFEQTLEEVLSLEQENLDFKLYGFDIDKKVIQGARKNIHHAGLEDIIEVKVSPLDLIEPPVEKGIVIVNPPYGERLDEDPQDSYKDLSYVLKNRFKGWTCWVLSGNRDLVTHLGLRSTRKFQVFNGPLECRFLKYEIRA